MTKRKTKRTRKARKEKSVEVDGHLLTPEQFRRYNAAIDVRMQQGRRGWDATSTALDDFLAAHRPTHRAERQLYAVHTRIMESVSGVGAAAKYPWFVRGKLREAGVEVLRTAASELHSAHTVLCAILEAIAAEDQEKLQDWQKRTAIIERDDQEVQS